VDHLVSELLPEGAVPPGRQEPLGACLNPLGLVELVLRVEKAFEVELPDEVLDLTRPLTMARSRAHLAPALGETDQP
jgi:hypothetical protein